MKKMSNPIFRKATEIKKGWGKEVVLANFDYCGKLLCFNEGTLISDHFHLLKSESFYVLKGSLRFFYYDLSNADRYNVVLNEGDIVDIPAGTPHQLSALVDSVIIEVSTHHEDSDSYRIGKGSTQMRGTK